MITTKNKKSFACKSCGATFPSWRGKCICNSWNTIEEFEVQHKKYVIPKVSEKSKKVSLENIGDETELQKWYNARHLEMKGVCQNCGGATQKGKDNFRSSIAHILEKSKLPSVATHESNWVELCFYGNSCHTNWDNKIIDTVDMKCFDDIVEKVSVMLPHIAQSEKRRIPRELLKIQ